MLKIGLTGGIASGKSAAAREFARLGAGIVDTDEIARDVVRPGTPGLAAVERAFGAAAIGPDGELDRAAMRSRILRNADDRRRLEKILHPLIRARTRQLIEASTAAYVVAVVPLLVETGFAGMVDRVLVVDCPRPLQLARLTARDGMSEADARAALDAQTDRDTRLAAADDVIDNGGDIEQLHEQVKALHTRYLALARDCPENEGRAE